MKISLKPLQEQINTMTTDSSDQYRTGDSSLFSLPNMSHICTQEETINRLYEDVQGDLTMTTSSDDVYSSHLLDSDDMPIYDQPCCDSDLNEEDPQQVGISLLTETLLTLMKSCSLSVYIKNSMQIFLNLKILTT